MSVKVYTSPSSQPANTYAVGNTNEQEQCRKIGSAVDKALDRCGFDSKVGLTGSMYTRVAESNAWGSDLHMPLHTNACNGDVAGLRIMVSKRGGEAEQIAQAIMDELAPITPGKSDGISVYPGLYEIANSKAICVYLEVGFHDNPEEAQWIIDHTEDIAEAICRGLCKHYGVKYIPANAEPTPEVKPAQKPAEKPETTDIIYRVQVGAYKVKKNAEALLAKVKAAGFEAFITLVDGLYKVQVGAFRERPNADAMLAKVKAAGFKAFITTKSGQAASTSTPKKSVDEIAREVIQGKWGSGATRKQKLEAAGYDYNAVQARVNQLL